LTGTQILTPFGTGAVAILALHGPQTVPILTRLTGRKAWPPGRLFRVEFGGIDDGLAVRLGPAAAELMPHGGRRVLEKLAEALQALGAEPAPAIPARARWPEAASQLEAWALDLAWRAASPAAVDRLLEEPARWRRWLAHPSPAAPQRLLAHAEALDHLVRPPTILVTGPPNVGKSTLTNRLAGRPLSVTSAEAGTTRDWVGGLVALAPGILARWIDTPGRRRGADAVEQAALEMAAPLGETADLVLAMGTPARPAEGALRPGGRAPDLWLLGRADTLAAPPPGTGDRPEAPLALSPLTGAGVGRLTRTLLERLGLRAPDPDLPWAFHPALREAVAAGERATLAAWLEASPPVP